jgi:hypothetical protein
MIQRFFEKTDEDNVYLFDGLEVSKAGEQYMAYQGQYPVVTLSLKGMKKDTFEEAIAQFGWMIAREYRRHPEIMQSELVDEADKARYQRIINEQATILDYQVSVQLLTDNLMRIYDKKTIVLIDGNNLSSISWK